MSLAEYGWVYTTKRPDQVWSAGEYTIQHLESGNGTFAKDSSQATLTYLCEYFEVEKFLDCVLGKTVKSGSTLLRSASSSNWNDANGSLPESHPDYENFYAATAEVTPMGTSTQTNTSPVWHKAKVTVVFRPPTYNVLGDTETLTNGELDRFVTKQPGGRAEFQTTQGFFAFVNDLIPGDRRVLDITPGFIIPSVTLQYTWHQIPTVDRADGKPDLGTVPNINTILSHYGQLNEVEFDGYPPGTVLFDDFAPKLVLPQVTTAGNYYWDITYSFKVRDYGLSDTPVVADEHVGWNYAYDPLQAKWRLYTTTGISTGGTQYLYNDLTDLFAVNW